MKYIIKHLMENKWIMFGGVALKTIGAFLELAIPTVLDMIINEVALRRTSSSSSYGVE